MEDSSSAEDRREEIRENQAGVGQWERNRRREMAERKDLTFFFLFNSTWLCDIRTVDVQIMWRWAEGG